MNGEAVRFKRGGVYRLYTSAAIPALVGGTIQIKGETKPPDTWGNRIMLADLRLDGKDAQSIQSVFCFVEEGYGEVVDSYGRRTVPTEIATIQGMYPLAAKAYAVDEMTAAGVA